MAKGWLPCIQSWNGGREVRLLEIMHSDTIHHTPLSHAVVRIMMMMMMMCCTFRCAFALAFLSEPAHPFE